MENLPQGWSSVRISDILVLINGLAFKSSQWKKHGLPIIRIQNLNDPNASFNYCPDNLPEKYRVKTGDLLFAWSGTPGTSFGAHVWFGNEAWLNQHIFRIEFDNLLLNKEFLKHAINQNLSSYIDQAHGTAGLAHITKPKFESSLILLPPHNEQDRIIAKLDQLIPKIKGCEERIEKIPRLLKRFRQSVLAAACSGHLTADWREHNKSILNNIPQSDDGGEYPPTWVCKTVEQLATIGSGQSSKDIIGRCKSDGDIPWFRVGDMNLDGNEKFMVKGQNYLSADDAKKLRIRIYPAGTITFPKRGGAIYTNKKRILAHPSCIDLNTMALIPKGCSDGYFWTWFSTINLGSLSDGSSVPQINNPDILPLVVPLPPLNEQQEIVRRVEALFKLADQLEERYKKAKVNVDKLTQSILAKAFRGELVPQDPNDEPASMLLERIKSQKTFSIPKKGKRRKNERSNNKHVVSTF